MPRNRAGRDLVVGDLHGHRSLFERELACIGFDPERDRVFSVGDLVDRGPESMATLELLEMPWFHAVLGNHEMLLLNYLGFYDSREHSRKAYVKGGGQWIGEAVNGRRKAITRLAEKVAALPFALEVEGDGEVFNVTHADLLSLGGGQKALVSEPNIGVHEVERATSSRKNITEASRLGFDLLHYTDHPVRVTALPFGDQPITYVGHSPVEHVSVHRSYVYIEQGVGSRPPTVLEHARFSRWLKGVAAGRAAGDSIAPAASDRTWK